MRTESDTKPTTRANGHSVALITPEWRAVDAAWLSGDIGYWWFSDAAIAADTQQEMTFRP